MNSVPKASLREKLKVKNKKWKGGIVERWNNMLRGLPTARLHDCKTA
jgi:hypothetical protein